MKHYPIDIVITDLMMPGMSGIELITSIRSNEKTKDLPIIALTGLSDEHWMEMAFSAGANAEIKKPPVVEDLVSAISQFL